ncbi:MAG: TRAP transporter small permease [Candidatus Adiutrix sp.]|jgi:TRAP-type C4-dicarboxylate transport system permease small subunit|nr:TRAP transporter small permease [Candidatus Adiutrix sp.]
MKALKWLDDNCEKFCCSVLFIGFTVVMIVNVFMRFVLENAIPWASDLVLFIFTWFVMFGMSYCLKTRSHISITVIADRLPPRVARLCAMLVNAVMFAFMLLICYNGLRLLGDRSVVNKYGLLFRYPLWSLYLALPVGCALSLIRIAQNFHSAMKAPNAREGGSQ